MIWRLSDKYDPAAVQLADRHYSRQKPGTPQFLRPGYNLAFVSVCGRAVWATWEGRARHAWQGAWENTIFRNEGAGLSSELIVQALAATVAAWGEPPSLGIVTFIDVDAVRSKKDPGFCYRVVGFEPVGWTLERGYLVLQLAPERFPDPDEALWTPRELAA